VRNAQSARSYEGMGSPANPSAARRTFSRAITRVVESGLPRPTPDHRLASFHPSRATITRFAEPASRTTAAMFQLISNSCTRAGGCVTEKVERSRKEQDATVHLDTQRMSRAARLHLRRKEHRIFCSATEATSQRLLRAP
jgi:hypothetical protein